eukprot:gene6610-10773_t
MKEEKQKTKRTPAILKEEIIKYLEYERNLKSKFIHAIIQIGSRLYKSSEPGSDFDFLCICSMIPKDFEERHQIRDINLHMMTEENYISNIINYDPFTLTSLWVPQKNIYLQTKKNYSIGTKSVILHFQNKFVMNLDQLEHKFLAEKKLCINKSERYFSQDKRISLKNIIHSIRYLMFGIQILENGKIIDFTCANEFYKKIFSLKYEKWDEYYEEMKDYLVTIELEFKTKIKDVKKEIENYNQFPKDSSSISSTILFLQKHGIEKLLLFFNLEYNNTDFGGEFKIKTSRMNPHQIEKECNCGLYVDKNFELIGFKIFYEQFQWNSVEKYEKFLNQENLIYKSQRTIYSYPDFALVFYDDISKNWKGLGSTWALKMNTFNKLNENYHSKSFIIESDNLLIAVYDRESKTLENHFQYQKIVDLQVLQKEPMTDFRALQLSFMEKKLNYGTSIILQDENLNQIEVLDPIGWATEATNKNQISESDGLLMFLKSRKELKNAESDFMNSAFGITASTMKEFDLSLKKYLDLIDEIVDSENPFFHEITNTMKKENLTVQQYFYLNNLATFKKYLNFKQVLKTEKIPDIWKNIEFSEKLPVELHELIFQFLPGRTMKYISTCVSSKFYWVRSSSDLIRIVLKNTTSLSAKVFKNLIPYFETPTFQLICRIIPYTTTKIGETFSIYDNLYLINPRKLNKFELNLFQLRNTNIMPKSIVSQKEFLNTFNQEFKFEFWKDLLQWEYFKVIGGSILKCLLKNSFKAKETQDIDIFFKGDYYSFDDAYYKFFEELKQYEATEEFHDDYIDRIRTIHVTIDSKKLTFQFILYNTDETDLNQFYQILDQDCCQIGFNGTKVFCTYSFIQSLNTGTMMNYHLLNDSCMTEKTEKRINKYSSRGFELLYPKCFDFENIKVLEEKFKSNYYSGGPFEENNDSMGIFDKAMELIYDH